MIGNTCIVFRYNGKFAHFLRAEANVSAPSYPFPSRTILLGLAGAILGLGKDTPQTTLNGSRFAVFGRAADTHWHTATFRQTYPAPLPAVIDKKNKGSSADQKLPKQIMQQWLIKPDYTVFAQLPSTYHETFMQRIKERRWHFSPCLGLSEMAARIDLIDVLPIEPLGYGAHSICTVVRKSRVELDMEKMMDSDTAVQSIRMPRQVTENREFSHEDYLYEINANPLPVHTADALNVGEWTIQWL